MRSRHPEKVIVFGSRAQGEAGRESDINLIVVLTDIYTNCRYPGDLGLMPSGKPREQDAARFEEFADHVHATVLSLLSHVIDEQELGVEHAS